MAVTDHAANGRAAAIMQPEAGYLPLTGEPNSSTARLGLLIIDDMSGSSTAMTNLVGIEQQFGEKITEVRQELMGTAMNTRSAALLCVRRGAPALRVARSYLNRRGEIVEMASSVHAADRYSYLQTFRRDNRGALS